MGRFVLLIVALFVLLWLVRNALSVTRRKTPDAGARVDAGELVRCAHCEMLVPVSEAHHARGLDFCSPEHLRLGPRRTP